MNIISRILKLFLTFCAFLLFTISLLLVFPCYIFVFTFWSKESAPFAAHRISRCWARITLSVMLIGCEIKGKEFIKPGETYILVCNHRSLVDVPVLAIGCKNTFHFLAKAELTKIPLMGYLIKRLYITVVRSDRVNRSQSLEAMKSSIDKNISVAIFPEGTRNKTNAPLLEFRDGAFRLAIKTQKPIAVLTILDSDRLLPPIGPLAVRPGIVHASWSKPIETEGMTDDDLPVLKEKVREIMLNILNKNSVKNNLAIEV